MLINDVFFRPGSDASTVPATEDEVKRRREEVRKTPRPQIKESKSTMELGEREPRLRRDVQSHELLGEPKRKAQKQPATAVKARAAPPKSVSPKAAQGDAKVEGTTPDRSQGVTALAVQECLHRRNTAELQEPTTPPAPSSSGKRKQSPSGSGKSKQSHASKSSGKKATPAPPPPPPPSESEHSQSASESESDDEEALALQEEVVREKKEAHARYMRFSRSLTSYLDLILIRSV